METYERDITIKVIKDTEKSCCSCTTFKGAWIYCPIYNAIADGDFDETGEKDGCEYYGL